MKGRLGALKESERFTFGGVIFVKIGKVVWNDKLIACQIVNEMAVVYISEEALVTRSA